MSLTVRRDGPSCVAAGCSWKPTLACAGHSKHNNPDTTRPYRCNVLICEAHAWEVLPGVRLCPRCAAAAREQIASVARHVVEAGDLTPLALLPAGGQRIPLDAPPDALRLVRVLSPCRQLWAVWRGRTGARSYSLAIDPGLSWELQKIPGILHVDPPPRPAPDATENRGPEAAGVE